MLRILTEYWFLFLAIDVLVIAGLGYGLARYWFNRLRREMEQKADNVLQVAQESARQIEIEARDKALATVSQAEEEARRQRAELAAQDERLQKRRTELDGRLEKLEAREQMLNKRQSSLDKRTNEVEHMASERREELLKIAQMTVDEARAQLMAELEKDVSGDMARYIHQAEQDARAEADRRARGIIVEAMQRVGSEYVGDVCSSVVPLPNEEMKGRIVGRNGRNIRAFEQASGVDVIVDDTPEAVTISCFDPVRREVARRSLTRLISDGRIHPAYIEKVLAEEQHEVEEDVYTAGDQAAFEVGLTGLHPEILRALGRLKYRTSYGQNQLAHATEVAKLAGIMAVELGADVETAKMGGLLHDIGKALDYNVDGTHARIGADYARKYGVPAKVVNAIESHHHEVDQQSIEAVIVEVADAISGARPGARREDLEQYVKRLTFLEDVAKSFKGVNESYAIQAGREVRIIVRPDQIDDSESTELARQIAKRIEESMQYPGQIKVTVIRETRAIEYAR
jgi:ribonuclease Y